MNHPRTEYAVMVDVTIAVAVILATLVAVAAPVTLAVNIKTVFLKMQGFFLTVM